MRIAMVSEHASPLAALGGADAGGQNVHVGALAEHLVALGHEVAVHTRRDSPDLSEWVTTPGGVAVHHVDAGPAERLAKDELLPHMERFGDVLAHTWSHFRPDVAHAHFWMSGVAARHAAQEVGIPVVQTFHALGVVKRRHQGPADTSPPEREGIEAALITAVDRIIATCHDEARELLALGAAPDQVAVVPCGVDLALFTPDGPAGARTAARRVAVVGRLVERKGVADVIAALAEVPGTELVVAGGPPAEGLGGDADVARLRLAAERHGVAARVHFLGQVARRDLPALLRSSDAVVCAPAYEPFGIVPLEAMACGVPVVASDVGGLRESVTHGVNGLHVPPGDPGALAAALRSLLDDGARRRRMGAEGRRRAERRYGWPGVARATASVYEQVVAATPARAAAR